VSASKTFPAPTQQAMVKIRLTPTFLRTQDHIICSYILVLSYDSLQLMSFVCLTKQTLTFAYAKYHFHHPHANLPFDHFLWNFLSLFMHHVVIGVYKEW